MKTIILILLYFFSLTITINSQNLKNEVELVSREANKNELNNIKSINLLNRFRNNKTTIWVKLFKSGEDVFENDNLLLTFFEDDNFFAKHVKTKKVSDEEFLWTGTIGETGVVSIYYNNGKLTGTVITKDNEYRIEPLENRVHALVKINKEIILKGKDETFESVIEYNEEKNKFSKQENISSIQSTTTTLDILVAYTQDVASSHNDMTGFINSIIGATEIVYSNSDINIDIRLVCEVEVSYVESCDFGLDLSRYRGSTDGNMDNIHQLRDKYLADIGILLLDEPEYVGDGTIIIGSTYQNPSSSSAFAVVADDYAGSGSWTFAHELGHIQAAHHDRATSTNNSYPYGHGFISVTDDLRTIMAYNNSSCPGGTCEKVPYFSNPNKVVNSITIGTTQYEDNSRVLNTTANLKASYRSPTINGTLSHDEVWIDSQTLTGNVYVPSGKTLTLSGITVNLDGNFIKSTGGSIVQESGSTINGTIAVLKTGNTTKGFFPTIQSSIDNAVSDQTVEIESGTFSGNLSLVNKNSVVLKGAGIGITTINGNITITNSSYAIVSDFSMGYSKTITVNGGYRPQILNISVTSGSGMISSYNVDGIIIKDLNYISNAAQAYGWGFYNSTNFNISNNTIEGYQFGIYSTSGSNIYMSGVHFCNNMLDLYATSDSWLYATLSYLSYPGAYMGENCSVGNILGYCSSGGIFKSNGSQNEHVANDNIREANLAFRALLSDEDISKSFTLTEKGKSKINAVITKYKNALLLNLSQSEVNEALGKLSSLYKMLDEVAIYSNYVTSLLSNKSLSKEMKRFLIPDIVAKGNYNDAINLIDEILTYKDIPLDLEYELLYEKGTIQKYYLKEKALSEEAFLNLYNKAGNHILGKYAKAQLENQSGLDDGNKPIKDDNSDISKDFEISSYPNPFNPTTTIAYQIPNDGFVNLVVYNTLGQVVAELVNEHQTSGKYSVQFNANNLPSGVYFYKIESGSFNKVSKMLLLR